jgi:L-fuculose-phosphate aldolase
MSKWENEKRIVLKVAQRMVEKGLVVGTSGNISLRLPPEKDRQLLAITPNRRYYDCLSTHDIQVVDFDGEPVEGDLIPSSETMLHIGIYRARENVNAVIHTHSVFASAISVAGLDIPPILDDQVSFLGGEIRLADYALAGSEELVENVLAALGERNAVILAHHGAVGTGRNLREAYISCELLEKTAKIYLLALALGSASTLSAEAVEVQKAFFAMLQSGSE